MLHWATWQRKNNCANKKKSCSPAEDQSCSCPDWLWDGTTVPSGTPAQHGSIFVWNWSHRPWINTFSEKRGANISTVDFLSSLEPDLTYQNTSEVIWRRLINSYDRNLSFGLWVRLTFVFFCSFQKNKRKQTGCILLTVAIPHVQCWIITPATTHLVPIINHKKGDKNEREREVVIVWCG